ncbi:hypothetical protein AMTR_s00029p00240100 [Amborella trichopoda]|uniref:Uncharacterized protein n=1 Tax=Amborella trichopoda TaxID=13333 RepID=W1PIH9_AMBTC|nr:hypothetical protein AMTR_s00029p00240100 [Amborella trichopoda]
MVHRIVSSFLSFSSASGRLVLGPCSEMFLLVSTICPIGMKSGRAKTGLGRDPTTKEQVIQDEAIDIAPIYHIPLKLNIHYDKDPVPNISSLESVELSP